VRFCAASDQAMLVYLGEEIGFAAHERVLKLLNLLRKQPPPWLRNLQPAYTSLMITFDPCLVDHAAVEATLLKLEQRAKTVRRPKSRTIEIPVCYGGEFGPDLQEVAKLRGLKPSQVIDLHSSQIYHAYFLGFAPGFAYLGDLPAKIATPRLETPRKKVPAGSVGIAGRQTGVYPFATPGGWRLIGRTPKQVFCINGKRAAAVISPGDLVKFRSISRNDFLKMDRA
jgi:inhibitor of KinA